MGNMIAGATIALISLVVGFALGKGPVKVDE